MSRLAESMYDYRYERKEPKTVDTCSDCGCYIYFGEEYYDVGGKIFCEECMDSYKRVGGEDE